MLEVDTLDEFLEVVLNLACGPLSDLLECREVAHRRLSWYISLDRDGGKRAHFFAETHLALLVAGDHGWKLHYLDLVPLCILCCHIIWVLLLVIGIIRGFLELFLEILPRQIYMGRVEFVPFGKFISAQDETVELEFLLLQILKAVSYWVLHDVEQDIVWVCIDEALSD